VKLRDGLLFDRSGILSVVASSNVNTRSIRFRLTIQFLVGVVALFGGLLILALLRPDDAVSAPKRVAEILQSTSLPVLLLNGILGPLAEAFVFSFMCIEGAALTRLNVRLGAVAGVFTYSVLYHWSKGTWGIVFSGWVIVVINCMYLAMRAHSVKAAFAGVVLLRWLFVGVAILLVRSYFL
jgi:hypothetical protein